MVPLQTICYRNRQYSAPGFGAVEFAVFVPGIVKFGASPFQAFTQDFFPFWDLPGTHWANLRDTVLKRFIQSSATTNISRLYPTDHPLRILDHIPSFVPNALSERLQFFSLF